MPEDATVSASFSVSLELFLERKGVEGLDESCGKLSGGASYFLFFLFFEDVKTS